LAKENSLRSLEELGIIWLAKIGFSIALLFCSSLQKIRFSLTKNQKEVNMENNKSSLHCKNNSFGSINWLQKFIWAIGIEFFADSLTTLDSLIATQLCVAANRSLNAAVWQSRSRSIQ